MVSQFYFNLVKRLYSNSDWYADNNNQSCSNIQKNIDKLTCLMVFLNYKTYKNPFSSFFNPLYLNE